MIQNYIASFKLVMENSSVHHQIMETVFHNCEPAKKCLSTENLRVQPGKALTREEDRWSMGTLEELQGSTIQMGISDD